MNSPLILYANNDVEKTVLSCIIQDSKNVDLSGISEDDFYYEQSKELFKSVKEMHLMNLAIDYVTVIDRLKKENIFDHIGGYEYITEVEGFAPTTSNYEQYKKMLKEYSVKRQVIKATEKIKEMIATDQDADVLFMAQEQLNNINRYENSSMSTIRELFISEVDDLLERKNTKELKGIKTGLESIDKRIVNIQPSDLVILAARSGMGKSAFMLVLARNNALKYNKRSLIFSLEMSKKQCASRLIQAEAQINGILYRSGKVTDKELDNIKLCAPKFDTDLIMIEDDPYVSLTTIESKAKRVIREKGSLDLIIIDFIQLISPERKYDSRHQEISEIARRLKVMAKNLNVPIICLSQINRGCEARQDKRPMLSDLKESGSLEENADLVMMLYRDEYYNKNTSKKNIVEVIINKNRYGYTGTVECGWRGEYQQILDIAQ